jgi:FAD/FMN-containing dehydrogenase
MITALRRPGRSSGDRKETGTGQGGTPPSVTGMDLHRNPIPPALTGALPRDRLVLPGDEAYDHQRRVWNGAVDAKPRLIAECSTPVEVAAVLRAARTDDVAVSVRAGGHDWTGRAVVDDAVVIDLRRMNEVVVDERARTARVGGGALNRDVLRAAEPHGLVPVVGVEGDVGVTGLALGGGYGCLTGQYGLALDNVLAAQVVLADGTIVEADEESKADLFWALRGGGGNFGVVTGLSLRLHALPTLMVGTIVYPFTDARTVLRDLAEVLIGAPDCLTVQGAITGGPNGQPIIVVSPAWVGDDADASGMNSALEQLTVLGTPLDVQLRRESLAAFSSRSDGNYPPGRGVVMRSRQVPTDRFGEEAVIDVVVEHASRFPTLTSSIAFRQFHGAAARVPAHSTPFAPRTAHVELEMVSMWDVSGASAETGSTSRSWADEVSEAVSPYALPGGYSNLLSSDDGAQVSATFGGNRARLASIKRDVDPGGVFAAIPIPR